MFNTDTKYFAAGTHSVTIKNEHSKTNNVWYMPGRALFGNVGDVQYGVFPESSKSTITDLKVYYFKN